MSIAGGGLTATEWLASPQGRYLLAREQSYFDDAVVDVFGYHAMQLGLEQVNLLRTNRIPLQVCVGPRGGVGLRADFRDLPVESNSVDLMVLPHTLEFTEHPHQVVRGKP